ncbi:hypothetical protein DP73_00720 [Desulfosporosinus sp. HMP52]|uniref:hypothetical protein n=1 Tax=Desulfosporosinus sp. HMP52 TaxID=1487923 RepID=UPI00051FAFE6|nr:hypothetical protein [Desulfosporosinus sp. HMP52]KGK91885.1 hypothetical protein DP73_00720 [Desulfosporosinus sp. HMP52]
MERLNNDQIAQKILDTNSDIKRYLNLAPGVKLTPPQPKPVNSCYNNPLSQAMFPRPKLKP